MKKILAVFLGLVVGVLGVAAVFAAILFFKPSWIINDRTLAKVPGLATKVDIEANWESGHIQATKPEVGVHRFVWGFDGMCVRVPSAPLGVCADAFAGGVDLRWTWREFPRVVHVDRVTGLGLTGGEVSAGPFLPSADDEPSTFDINRVELPWILAGASLDPARIDLAKLDVHLPGGTLTGRATIDLSQRGRDLVIAVNEPGTFAPLCWRAQQSLTNWSPASKSPMSEQPQCVGQLSVVAALGVRGDYVRVTQIGPAHVAAGDLRLAFATAPPPATASRLDQPTDPGSSAPTVPPFLAEGSVHPITVDIRDSSVTVDASGQPFSVEGSLSAAVRPLEPESLGSLHRVDLDVDATKLCLDGALAQGCIDRFALTLGAGRDEPGPWAIRSVDRAFVDIARMNINLPKDDTVDAPSTSSSSTSSEPTLDWRDLRFATSNRKEFHVAIDNLTINSGKERLARIRALVEPSPSKGQVEWRLDASATPYNSKLSNLTLKARIPSNSRPLRGPFHGSVDARANLTSGESITLNLTGRQDANDAIALDGQISAEKIKRLATSTIKLRGTVSEERADLDLSGILKVGPAAARITLPNATSQVVCDEKPPPGPHLDLNAVTIEQCKISLSYANGFPTAKLDTSCPLAFSSTLTSPEAVAHAEPLPINATLLIAIDAEGASREWLGDGSIALADHSFGKNQKIDLGTRVAGSFRTSQADPANDLTWTVNGGVDLAISKFSWLVETMRHQPWAIPAPLNTLEGATKLSIKVTGDSKSGRIVAPIGFTTALTSPEQSLVVGIDGHFVLEGLASATPQQYFNAKVDLRDIALTLPHLSIREKLPTLFPDKRIDPGTCPEPPPSKPSSLVYRVVINTGEKPIRLSTNLTKDVIPIAVHDLTIRPNGIKGEIALERFGFEVFRRKAAVRGFSIKLDPSLDSPEVNGAIEYVTTDININILLGGTSEEPIVRFESTPIRTEREIITYLLYGSDVSAIDDDQLQTADDLSGAMADRMIGLASLYLLATTPVESVRYNPATKAFVAKVRLDKKTSLNFGTTVDSDPRFGVRRRISKTWAIQTDIAKDEESGVTSGSALLEWSTRF